MPIPLRHLRAHADDLPGNRFRPTTWELEQQDRIIATATALFVQFGRIGLSMNSLATAMRMSAHTIRRHFADLDTLLAEILFRHLLAVSTEIGKTPRDTDNPKAARRAAYVTATRTAFNAPTQQHMLLLRERHALPPDLAETVEQLRTQLGEMLAGAHADVALALLDEPTLQPPQIEAMLTALAPQPAATPPADPAKPIRLATTNPRLTPTPPRPPEPQHRPHATHCHRAQDGPDARRAHIYQ